MIVADDGCLILSAISQCDLKCIALVLSLQKQITFFNHRVVVLFADKLERQWVLKVCFDVED